jgi:hypothetical protein
MIKFIMQNKHLDRDLTENRQSIPKDVFQNMIRNLTFGKTLTGSEIAVLILVTTNKDTESNVSRDHLVKLSRMDQDALEDLFQTWDGKGDEAAAIEEARRAEEEMEKMKEDIAQHEEEEKIEAHLLEVAHEQEVLGKLANILLKGRMLPTHCSITEETNVTASDNEAYDHLETVTAELGLECAQTAFVIALEKAVEEEDTKAEERLHVGDGDRGLCDALSRAVWGDETFSKFLNERVTREIIRNQAWYAKRVGLACTNLASSAATEMTPTKHDMTNSLVSGATSSLVSGFSAFGKALDNGLELGLDGGPVLTRHNSLCYVHVHVVECAGIPLPKGVEHVGPCCIVSDGKTHFETLPQKQTLAPKFNECCTFFMSSYSMLMDTDLRVQIGAASSLIGEASISFFEKSKPGAYFRETYDLYAEGDSLAGGLTAASLAGAVSGVAAERKKTGGTVTLDIYIGADMEAEKTSIRMLAAATVLKRPIFVCSPDADNKHHGEGFFGATGLFPPLRVADKTYYKSPIGVGWRDQGWFRKPLSVLLVINI